MNQSGNQIFKNNTTPEDSFLTAIGKAAEEELLVECERWEQQAGDVSVPRNVEFRILALVRNQQQPNKKKDWFGNTLPDCEGIRNL